MASCNVVPINDDKACPLTHRRLASAAYRAGFLLGIELLDEASWSDEAYSFPDHNREGKPHDNLVLRFLDRVAAHDDPEVREGFAALLTDHLAIGGDADMYAKAVELMGVRVARE